MTTVSLHNRPRRRHARILGPTLCIQNSLIGYGDANYNPVGFGPRVGPGIYSDLLILYRRVLLMGGCVCECVPTRNHLYFPRSDDRSEGALESRVGLVDVPTLAPSSGSVLERRLENRPNLQ